MVQQVINAGKRIKIINCVLIEGSIVSNETPLLTVILGNDEGYVSTRGGVRLDVVDIQESLKLMFNLLSFMRSQIIGRGMEK